MANDHYPSLLARAFAHAPSEWLVWNDLPNDISTLKYINDIIFKAEKPGSYEISNPSVDSVSAAIEKLEEFCTRRSLAMFDLTCDADLMKLLSYAFKSCKQPFLQWQPRMKQLEVRSYMMIGILSTVYGFCVPKDLSQDTFKATLALLGNIGSSHKSVFTRQLRPPSNPRRSAVTVEQLTEDDDASSYDEVCDND